MVTTEVAQLSKECNAWRETLRSYRDVLGTMKHQLEDVAARQTHQDILLEVEHLDNQFEIQLINIHDLKQHIKLHSRKIGQEQIMNGSQMPNETLSEHNDLHSEYRRLENTLQELRQEFGEFLQQT